MTIRKKGYTHWEGELKESFLVWFPLTRLGIKLAFQRRFFRLFFFSSFLPALIFLAGIYISERLEDFRFMLKGSPPFLQITPNFFKIYLSSGLFLVLLVLMMIFVGSGLIADDLRFNALQLYFARPLRKIDYLVGKIATLSFFILLLSLVPGLLFILFKLLFAGNLVFLRTYPWLPLAVIGYSLLLTLFFAGYALALSALSRNSRYVSLMIFGIYIASDIVFGIFYQNFHHPYLALLSIKLNLQQVAAAIFGQKPFYQVPWELSLAILLGLMVGAYFILQRRIRSVEVVK
ncbi:ABC transporter permease subunit [Candidatus Aminicenantes bacterium AC-334-K16]|jgi:ABC-type transport system involved in multi-copper enzyme maturation permease subunit|nr:ABC transporter permease subunit [Candidatus Aminicenantes bacterium AC-334-K16]